MINQSKKHITHTYSLIISVIAFFIFTPLLFADQENDGKETFFKILSPEIPKTRNIVYITETHSSDPRVKIKPTITVKAMKDDGSDNVAIIEGKSIFSIQISPDRKKLLLIAPDHSPGKNDNTDWLNSHIWLYSEGKLKQLTNGMVMDSDAIWSTEGDKIYFTRSKIFSDIISGMLNTSESNVWVMNSDGLEPLQLTYSKKDIINITPAPIKGSKKILFTTNRNTTWQMFVMDEDGSNQKLFIDNGMLGSWSPDGKFLAYMDSSPGNIHLADQDGKLIRRLTKEGDVDFSATWSPDSQYLTYSRINAAHLDNTHLSSDTHLHENEEFAGRIPQNFLQEEPYADIWKLSINQTEAPKRLTNKGLNNNFPHWITTSLD